MILLKICILDMPSYTYAVKAQRLLRARGYPCRIRRREKTSSEGCGFSVLINGSCEGAERLLTGYAVPYSVRGGGADDDKL
ncbi:MULTISPECIES: putative Se/S carrier-like protein [Ruminococcus]|uniref:putative Se/S carrier-like protein n=1 Tax=Ruminococcus TaxID=1263 RepID=UPI0011B21878|nr:MULTISPECIES: putative Se/S carrier-like protein [Ruminococcus]MBQ6168490.1 DUF3343 domain-containing protein [Ruminococcus sp.]MBR1432142.1 DUF3343 domain-containing protein [Ruminococcus sp.]